MTGVSTHVLDTAKGKPAAGVEVRLHTRDGVLVGVGSTDEDGRVPGLTAGALDAGIYRLVFDTAGYFASTGQQGFYPEVTITFTLADPGQHHHVPLLLSPFAYSTYRGS